MQHTHAAHPVRPSSKPTTALGSRGVEGVMQEKVMVSTTSDSQRDTTAGQQGTSVGGSMECTVISSGNRWRTWSPSI